MLKKGDSFTCEHCKGVFETAWSDEDSNKEAEQLWDVKDAHAQPHMAVVCDDCYMMMISLMPIKEWRAKNE